MKRSILAALVICVIVSGLVIALHLSGLLMRAELMSTALLSSHSAATKFVSEKFQYALVILLAFGVAWGAIATTRRDRLGWLAAAL
ncbi:MAG: hypothetical protein ABI944_05345, partial [Chthoniobacterales bacterium]